MDCEEDDEPKASTSTQLTALIQNPEKKLDDDQELSKALDIEEFLLKSKTYMLEYEKHMFMDTIDADCLVVSAK